MAKVIQQVSQYNIIRTDDQNVKVIKVGAIGEKGDAGEGVAQGGAVGEILTKQSAVDYTTEWQSTSELGLALTANNLSDMADLNTVKENLNLVIGQDVQAHSNVLSNTTASYTIAEQSKLAGIEDNATGDQSATDIIALLDDDQSFNFFTDAEQIKLQGIEAGATGDLTGGEIKALYEAQIDTNAYTDADKSKLDSVEIGATGDQSAAEIKSLYESNSDTNAFTDAYMQKLDDLVVEEFLERRNI